MNYLYALPSYLPSLPSFPSLSLPQNIQKRFLAYVLKKTIGHLVKGGEVDPARLNTQIREGKVEIEGVELDEETINRMIPSSLPLLLESGSLGTLTALIPWYSKPFASTSSSSSTPPTSPLNSGISLSLSHLYLNFTLSSPPPSSTPPARGTTPKPSSTAKVDQHIDLAQSVVTVTEDFLHSELNAQESRHLAASFATVHATSSPLAADVNPFSWKEDEEEEEESEDWLPPGAMPSSSRGNGEKEKKQRKSADLMEDIGEEETKTFLKGVVEGLIRRLKVDVKDVRIRVKWLPSPNREGNGQMEGSELEFRIGQVRFREEGFSAPSASSAPPGNDGSSAVKALRFSDVSLSIRHIDHPPSSVATPTLRSKFLSSPASTSTSSDSSSSSSSSDNDDDDDEAAMMMFRATIDLRQSHLGEESVYESARGGSFFGGVSTVGQLPNVLEEEEKEREEGSWEKLVSFGNREVVFKLSDNGGPGQKGPASAPSSSSGHPQRASSSVPRKSHSSLEITIPPLTLLLLPQTARSLLHAVSILQAHSTTLDTSSPIPYPLPNTSPPPSKGPNLYLSAHLQSFTGAIVYSDQPISEQLKVDFWTKKNGGQLAVGWLEVGVEDVRGEWLVGENVPPAAAPTQTQPDRRLSIKDVYLFEHLHPSAAPPMLSGQHSTMPSLTYPILVFDPNLAAQKELSDPAGQAFPEFAYHDWRASASKTRRGVEGWRGRSRRGGYEKDGVEGGTEAVVLEKGSMAGSGLTLSLLPIHIFCDLSLVNRLLPWLRSLPSFTPPLPTPSRRIPLDGDDPIFLDPLPKKALQVIDHLEASDEFVPQGGPSPVPPPSLLVKLPLLRAEFRCPAPASSQSLSETLGDGSFVRSGILILDVHDACLSLGVSNPSPSSRGPRSAPAYRTYRNEPVAEDSAGLSLEWKKLALAFARVSDNKAKAFVLLGSIGVGTLHDPLVDEVPLRSRIQIRTEFAKPSFSQPIRRSPNKATAGQSCQVIECRIPSVRANIQKGTIDGLQYFADDITQWLDGALGDGVQPIPREDIKMIGSRFFGTRVSSEDSEEDGLDGMDGEQSGSLKVQLSVSNVDVILSVPRFSEVDEIQPDRKLHVWVADLDVEANVSSAFKKETSIKISVLDALLEDLSNPSKATTMFARTINRSLDQLSKPLLFIRVVNSSEIDSTSKETDLQLVASNCTYFGSTDVSWISDVELFLKPPEGAFVDVVPSEVTRIKLELQDTSVHLAAPTHPGAIVLVLGNLVVSTELMGEFQDKALDLAGSSIRVFVIDDLSALSAESKSSSSKPVNAAAYWTKLGYALTVNVSTVETIIELFKENPKAKVDILTLHLQVITCPDSIPTITALIGDVTQGFSRAEKISPKPNPSPTTSSISSSRPDLLSSIDDDAFRQQPSLVGDADFVGDDLPQNFDYLHTYRPPSGPPEPLSTFETVELGPSLKPGVISNVDGETIRLLDPQGIQIVEDYWSTVQAQKREEVIETSGKPTMQLRLRNCDVSLCLHDGFDWQHTRKIIENEVKVVRRRLEKIRQLLASGQTPDESIEQAGTTLFGSIYVGAPQFSTDFDASGYLGAIGDEDLLHQDLTDTASQPTSFQSVKGRPGGSSPIPPKSKSKKPKLTRSKHARIVINLHQIRAVVKSYDLGSELASGVQVTVQDLDILDQIKTSTWKKFLTGMRSDSRGNVREAESHMVSIELKAVRPLPDNPSEEGRLKAKILPLRLHVDQDALDFLKRFFAFKDTRPTPVVSPDAKETYFQHVEIFPVELKLDYKPKRVDYRGLREGRTIELMNFFHFDGAEMTLRKITLNGVTGWARIFDTLNDLWTPDVKANQLADVISGVAPIRSLVNVGSGVADLILLPIEQYKKDGRIVRGVQKGTTSFVKSTAMEALKLGAKLATGTQVILERAEHVIGGKFGQAVTAETLQENALHQRSETGASSDEEADEVSRYANQPADVSEGISTAYKSLSRNLNSAAETILAVPMEVYERSGTNGPVRAVVRAIPIAVLKPMIGASEAVSKTLFGLRNTLDPNAIQEAEDKYK